MAVSAAAADGLIEGRSCKDCTLCCKLLEVAPLAKPRAQWCMHCDQKRGCRIYYDRPEACRSFFCGYRRIPDLDERWKPSRAKFLINFETAANRIVIHADPTRPDGWRVEPFYSAIKQWARAAATEGGSVLVWSGPEATLVLPTREKSLGKVRDDQYLLAVERIGSRGPEIDYEVVESTDPRVKR